MDQGHASIVSFVATRSHYYPPLPISRRKNELEESCGSWPRFVFASYVTKSSVFPAFLFTAKNESENSHGSGPCFPFCFCCDRNFMAPPASHFEVKNEPEISHGSGPCFTLVRLGAKDAFTCAPVQGHCVHKDAHFRLFRNLFPLTLPRL